MLNIQIFPAFKKQLFALIREHSGTIKDAILTSLSRSLSPHLIQQAMAREKRHFESLFLTLYLPILIQAMASMGGEREAPF